jgi:hypothetical protein
VAKSYQNLISETREMLQDTDVVDPRYADSTLLNILNRGLQDLSRIRPDITYTLFTGNSLEVPEIVESAPGAGQVIWTDPFGLEMQFYPTMLSYLVGVAEIVDDEYTEDGRAAMFMQAFHNNAIGI